MLILSGNQQFLDILLQLAQCFLSACHFITYPRYWLVFTATLIEYTFILIVPLFPQNLKGQLYLLVVGTTETQAMVMEQTAESGVFVVHMHLTGAVPVDDVTTEFRVAPVR